jgi:glycogen(starch) synthase
MRIGLITTEFPPHDGGEIGAYCGNLARGLVQAGHEVHVLMQGGRKGLVDGVHVHPFTIPDAPEGDLLRAGLLYFGSDYERTFHLAARVRDFVRETQVDVVESQDSLGLLFQSLYDRLWQRDPFVVPSIVTLHGGSSELLEANGLPGHALSAYMSSFLEDCAIRWADGIVSPSRWLAERTTRRLGLPAGSVHVCPYPVTVQDEPAGSREACEILFVGRLERRKGIEILTRALPQIFRAREDCRIRFVGAHWYDYARRAPIHTWMMSKLRGFEDRLIFEGHQPPDRVHAAMRRATLVVMPSTWENFPHVCLEACAAGAPVLASDGNGMAEIIEEGKSGFFFPHGSADALAARTIELLELDAQQRNCIGRHGRERVRAICDPQRVAEDRVRHYRDVVAKTRGGGLPRYPQHLRARTAPPASAGRAPERLAVIIPCYNMGDTIGETIDSIRQSTRPPDDLIVVDDGSNDPRTLEVLSALGPDVRVVRSDNRGLSAARNLGARSTSADVLLFIDADDLLDREFVATAWTVLERHGDVGAVAPWAEVFGAVEVLCCVPVPHFPLLLHQNLVLSSVGLIRRAAYEAAGGFKEAMTYGYEDWQLWISLLDAGWGMLRVPLPLMKYRVRPDSMLRAIGDRANAFLLEQLVSLTPRPFQAYAAECRRLEAGRTLSEPTHAEQLVARIVAGGATRISIYGAGGGGRMMLGQLKPYGLEVRRFVDRDEKLWGSTVESVPVCSLSEAIENGDTFFLIGSLMFDAEMTRAIEQAFEGRAERPTIIRW